MMAGASRLGASLCCRLSQLASPITHVIGQARPRCRIAAGSRPAFAVECGTRTPRVRFGPTPTPPAKGSGGQGIGRPRDRAANNLGLRSAPIVECHRLQGGALQDLDVTAVLMGN
jgi:hypothetical protein